MRLDQSNVFYTPQPNAQGFKQPSYRPTQTRDVDTWGVLGKSVPRAASGVASGGIGPVYQPPKPGVKAQGSETLGGNISIPWENPLQQRFLDEDARVAGIAAAKQGMDSANTESTVWDFNAQGRDDSAVILAKKKTVYDANIAAGKTPDEATKAADDSVLGLIGNEGLRSAYTMDSFVQPGGEFNYGLGGPKDYTSDLRKRLGLDTTPEQIYDYYLKGQAANYGDAWNADRTVRAPYLDPSTGKPNADGSGGNGNAFFDNYPFITQAAVKAAKERGMDLSKISMEQLVGDYINFLRDNLALPVTQTGKKVEPPPPPGGGGGWGGGYGGGGGYGSGGGAYDQWLGSLKNWNIRI